MDPFANEEDNKNTNSKVTIWLEIIGKKKNTMISGLPYSHSEFKEHLKNLKKKHGCNGSIKEYILRDGNMIEFDKKDPNNQEDEMKFNVIQLQGDHIDQVETYFNNLGIKDIIINRSE
jgi:translation initiation factor 1 (eIF-1/SUI1)